MFASAAPLVISLAETVSSTALRRQAVGVKSIVAVMPHLSTGSSLTGLPVTQLIIAEMVLKVPLELSPTSDSRIIKRWLSYRLNPMYQYLVVVIDM